MRAGIRFGVIGLAAVVFGACAPASTGPTRSLAGEKGQPAAFKRITAVVRSAPPSLVLLKTQRSGALRGLDAIQELSNAGLTHLRFDGARVAQMAEAAPSIENGLWTILPDGGMETT